MRQGGGRYDVLLVERDSAVRRVFVRLLERRGFSVVCAVAGKDLPDAHVIVTEAVVEGEWPYEQVCTAVRSGTPTVILGPLPASLRPAAHVTCCEKIDAVRELAGLVALLRARAPAHADDAHPSRPI